MKKIEIIGAYEGNLRNVSVKLPRETLTVVTGPSGSGKTTLVTDVLFTECQRQYLEAMGMEGIRKPNVERVKGATPAIRIAQHGYSANPRSSVGTVTALYTDLRMLYEKLSVRRCPACGKRICAADCRETTEKIGQDFFVYMDCSECGHRMDKLTRSHFSFNTREGACPTCQGLGTVYAIDAEKTIDESRSLEDGAVGFWQHVYKDYQIASLTAGYRHYGLPYAPGTPVKDLSAAQKALLKYGAGSAEARSLLEGHPLPRTVAEGRVEGVYPALMRKLADKGGDASAVGDFFSLTPCAHCQGERLNDASRAATVNGTRLPELSLLPLSALMDWLSALKKTLNERERLLVGDFLKDLETKLARLSSVGLFYLTLDRQTMTLSGGESQRIKLAATLDSELTGVLYILDEPTIGLHPHDTAGMVKVLKRMRDLGNTVVVIEHDEDVMLEADHIVDMGPGAGRFGGEIVGEGTLEELVRNPRSVTGRYLRTDHKDASRKRCGDGGAISVTGACLHNLKNLNVRIPTGTVTSVTGVSGSGKSTLVFDVIASRGKNVRGLDAFDKVITIDQSAPARMKRSNAASYIGVYTPIRDLFAKTEAAGRAGLTARDFSFNVKGGRCETCEGLGTVKSNMLFFLDMETPCPACGGKRFGENVLSVRWQCLSIDQVLELTVEEAVGVFKGHAAIEKPLALLQAVGLNYLPLGQTLTTLSGGEAQRLKLARSLLESKNEKNLYLIDEPTTGLHMQDVDHFIELIEQMADAGNTVVVVEHNPQLIRASDHVIDLGPGGGDEGGTVVAEGTPEEIRSCPQSLTGRYI